MSLNSNIAWIFVSMDSNTFLKVDIPLTLNIYFVIVKKYCLIPYLNVIKKFGVDCEIFSWRRKKPQQKTNKQKKNKQTKTSQQGFQTQQQKLSFE